MSQSGTTAPTATDAGTIIQTLIAGLKGDVVLSAAGLLTGFFNSVQKNPSVENVIASGVALTVQAPLQLPDLEAEAIGLFATAGQQLTALGVNAAGV